MSELRNTTLGELRAIAYALCENDNIKTQFVTSLRIFCSSMIRRDVLDAADHIDLIQRANSTDLCAIELALCKDEEIENRVDNYLQVLRHSKPAEVTTEAADPSNPLEKATGKELHNIILAICDGEDAKKRVTNHLRILRRSNIDGAAHAEADPVALINSATEMELRAIGLAMVDGDEDTKKRLLESLRVLSIFGKLQGTEARNSSFQCLMCKASYHEQKNTPGSCRYHPGKVSTFNPGGERACLTDCGHRPL